MTGTFVSPRSRRGADEMEVYIIALRCGCTVARWMWRHVCKHAANTLTASLQTDVFLPPGEWCIEREQDVLFGGFFGGGGGGDTADGATECATVGDPDTYCLNNDEHSDYVGMVCNNDGRPANSASTNSASMNSARRSPNDLELARAALLRVQHAVGRLVGWCGVLCPFVHYLVG